mgnify:CR=1 FL=1|tara:strand:- start:568 stop:2226 length:1659 start_codon:yes stop_codon:yes gene_type:complete
MAYNIKAKDVREILNKHDSFWEKKQQELFQFKMCYETNFWDKDQLEPMQMTVQTSDGYAYIESYIASLFSRNPGIIVKSGLRGAGSAEKAQALANDFLISHRGTIEDASRLALIYPMSFIKLIPVDNPDIYKRVDMMACSPWDVILDRDVSRIQDMRFIAHRYYLPQNEVIAKYGNKQSYSFTTKKDYFDDYMGGISEDETYGGSESMFSFLEIVEFYDLVADRLYIYSPGFARGERFLMDEEIPFRDNDGMPVYPIIPFYFNRKPDVPLEGYSAMKRVYDQLFEINTIRTFQANAVRKASRQYIVKRGLLDEESMAQVTSGIDGLFVEVDADDINNVIRNVPQIQTPPEIQFYYDQVQKDKDKGSILAPFTRGESTRSSATEIAALAAYTSSEVGRLARERDATIEQVAKVYIDIMCMYLMEDDTRDVIVINNRDEVVKAGDLKGNWVIFAQDQASTPISESVRKREFLQSIPLLQSLGVPADTLLSEVVRSLGLPESFIEEARKEQQAQVSAAKGRSAGEAIQPDAVELQQASQPTGPNNLQAILNQGEG